MSKWYLFKLNFAYWVCKAIELPLIFLPGWFLRQRILDPMACASQGSVDAACIARKRGWAINIGGGFHHATRSSGSGFCIYPDITFITHYMEKWHGMKKFMIVDLDAHQGNGHGRDHMDKTKYYILDCYNHWIYPGDEFAATAISANIDASKYDNDKAYLSKVREVLSRALDDFQPEMLIYNAGTDCMAGDPLGQLSITETGIIQRDDLVF